jgi:transcriptional/translational regulatory protein YebC/TACO1
VAWQFEKKGVILVDGDRFSEDDLMPAIDAGAEDVVLDDDVLKLTTDPTALSAVRSALEGAGVEVQSADLAMEPNAVVEIGEEREARALVRLMEALDDHDDVEAVHANFDIPEALLEQVAA